MLRMTVVSTEIQTRLLPNESRRSFVHDFVHYYFSLLLLKQEGMNNVSQAY
jgi:hypothetical protein